MKIYIYYWDGKVHRGNVLKFHSRYVWFISLGLNIVQHILDTVITQPAIFRQFNLEVTYSIFKGDVLNGYVREAVGSNEAT